MQGADVSMLLTDSVVNSHSYPNVPPNVYAIQAAYLFCCDSVVSGECPLVPKMHTWWTIPTLTWHQLLVCEGWCWFCSKVVALVARCQLHLAVVRPDCFLEHFRDHPSSRTMSSQFPTGVALTKPSFEEGTLTSPTAHPSRTTTAQAILLATSPLPTMGAMDAQSS